MMLHTIYNGLLYVYGEIFTCYHGVSAFHRRRFVPEDGSMVLKYVACSLHIICELPTT